MAIFYVSSSYTGTTSNGAFATPWKTLAQVQTAGNNGTIRAGDSILFKRGDTFYCVDRTFGGFRWWCGIFGGLCPKGTISAPITFSAYGNNADPLPNFLYPNGSVIDSWNRVVLQFLGADYIIIENLQFNDDRDPISTPGYPLTGRKVGGAVTGKPIQLGEGSGASKCNNIVVRNCYMNNVGYGIISAGDNNSFTNNYFENFGNCYPYTAGSYGSVGIEVRGTGNLIERNTIKGAWSWAQTFSWNGGALEFINSNSNTIVRYNTFIDCPGIAEFGSNSGAQAVSNITFCYNKIINCSSISYVNTSGPFAIAASGIKFYNNVFIENADSRYSGVGFGTGAENFPTNQVGSCPRLPEPARNCFGFGTSADTSILLEIKNNIFISPNAPITWNDAYNGTTCTAIRTYTRSTFSTNPRIVFSNNLYKMTNGATVGHTLGLAEISTTSQLFTDESNPDLTLWEFLPFPTGPLVNAGTNVSLRFDYSSQVVNDPPEIGINELVVAPSCLAKQYDVKGYTNIKYTDCSGALITIPFLMGNAAVGGINPTPLMCLAPGTDITEFNFSSNYALIPTANNNTPC